jgi:hypothetical protein
LACGELSKGEAVRCHRPRGNLRGLILSVIGLILSVPICAQSPPPSGDSAGLQAEVDALRSSLSDARADLERSHQEVADLRRRLEELEARLGPAAGKSAQPAPAPEYPTLGEALKAQQSAAPAGPGEATQEHQDMLAAQVEEQNQTKVESASRYKVKLSGLVLMNAYSTRGAVDNSDLPGLAFPRASGQTDGNSGATLRQTLLGLDVTGPKLAGASTAADVQMDFFGGFPEYQYGFTAGLVRLRVARISLDWSGTRLVVGQEAPFFSPQSPTSYASVGEPALAWAGNLWVWTPQVRLEHRWSLSDSSGITLQGGLLDPLTEYIPDFEFNRTPTPGESSRAPAVATHLVWDGNLWKQPVSVGVGSYYERQAWGFDRNVDAWAGTADWSVPLGQRLGFSGEFYRGRALGGLGGGVWNSIVANGDPDLASTRIVGLNTVGGWSQLKIKAKPKLEFNVAAGTDNPLASDLRIFSNPMGTEFPANARNQSLFVNSIYHPRSNLILALEYRRLRTYRPEDTQAATADHVNLAVGVAF